MTRLELDPPATPTLLRAYDPDTATVYLKLRVGERIVAEREMRGSAQDRHDLAVAERHLTAHRALLTPDVTPSPLAVQEFTAMCVVLFGEKVRRWFV